MSNKLIISARRVKTSYECFEGPSTSKVTKFNPLTSRPNKFLLTVKYNVTISTYSVILVTYLNSRSIMP